MTDGGALPSINMPIGRKGERYMSEKNKSGGIVVQKKHIAIAVALALILIIAGIVVGLNWNNWFGTQGGYFCYSGF